MNRKSGRFLSPSLEVDSILIIREQAIRHKLLSRSSIVTHPVGCPECATLTKWVSVSRWGPQNRRKGPKTAPKPHRSPETEGKRSSSPRLVVEERGCTICSSRDFYCPKALSGVMSPTRDGSQVVFVRRDDLWYNSFSEAADVCNRPIATVPGAWSPIICPVEAIDLQVETASRARQSARIKGKNKQKKENKRWRTLVCGNGSLS